MISLYVMGMWSGILAQSSVYAASLHQRPGQHPPTVTPSAHSPTPAGHRSKQPPVKHHLTPTVSSSMPFDGLGDLPFYTYITYRIDDHLELKVNVANGNLLVHLSNLHIRGTGIDESIEAYYNSQVSLLTSDLGNNWNLNQGHDVRLDLANPTQGITFHGPSGYSAFFAYNGSGWNDAPGLNATLVHNQDGTYTLTFHRTGEQLLFGTNSHLAADKDKNGNSLSYSYNSTHDLLSLTDTQSRVTTFTHNTAYGSTSDPSGQLTGLTDPAGRSVVYTYNERSNPANSFTSLTDVMGKITTFDYSGGDLITITDPLGHVTAIKYLTGDKVGTITDATGQGKISFTYNSGNTVVTDRNGHNTTYTYDTQKLQVTSVTDALGHSKSTQFDANYDVQQYGDALGDLSVFTFSTDGRNNLNAVAFGSTGTSSGATTTFGYPSSGNNLYDPLSQTDPQGNVTTYAYDTNGNMLSAIDAKTNKGLTYTYNQSPANGVLTKITDADGNVTTFGYDAHWNLTKVTPPSPLGAETLVVDAQTSRVTSVTDGNNNQTSYTYDAFDRVKTISYAGGGSISYTYDDDGNLLTEVDNTGTTSFVYDVLNRLKTKTLPGGTVISTDYDKNGNLTSLNDGGGAVTYGYDAANRMTTLSEPDGAQTSYTYDNADRKTMIQYPNGTGMKMVYNSTGQITSSIGGPMNSSGTVLTTYSSYSYTYTSGTTPTALIQTVDLLDPVNHNATYHRVYTYDTQNRLTVADVTQGGSEVQKWSYGYDPAGNRTSASVLSPASSTSYAYIGGNELQSTTQGGSTTTYSYDGNGNLTGSSSGPSFAYNSKNQTRSIGSNSYTYSGADQRDLVHINSDTFVYSGLGLSSRKDSGGAITHFVRCSCGLLNNERTADGKKYYYLFDGLGSIVGMTDSTGSEVNRYDYDPYGNMLNQQEQSGLNNPWKFAGGYLDSNTGLYHFGARYYDPSLGRWTQQDPVGGSLGDLGSANRYAYANDNPVNLTDPTGASCAFDLVANLISVGFTAYTGISIFISLGAVIGGAVLTTGLVVSAIAFPILAVIAAYYLSTAIEECLGYPSQGIGL